MKKRIITTPQGNNAFSYEKRKERLGKAEIVLPSLKHITHISEIQLGKQVVFEEIDHAGKLRSCTGLQHIYHLPRPNQDIYIFDNHNHALYLRIQYMTKQNSPLPTNDSECLGEGLGVRVIHIDQHSDLNTPPKLLNPQKLHDLQYIWDYTNLTCNVGNFIPPFLEAFHEVDFERIKSESQLLTSSPLVKEGLGEICNKYTKRHTTILDIDLDFRAPGMSISNMKATIDKTKEICKNASLITIATSPYFLDQQDALGLLEKILSDQ